MEEGTLRPPQLPHFSTDIFLKLKTKKLMRETTIRAKFGEDRLTGGVGEHSFFAVLSGLPFYRAMHVAQSALLLR